MIAGLEHIKGLEQNAENGMKVKSLHTGIM